MTLLRLTDEELRMVREGLAARVVQLQTFLDVCPTDTFQLAKQAMAGQLDAFRAFHTQVIQMSLPPKLTWTFTRGEGGLCPTVRAGIYRIVQDVRFIRWGAYDQDVRFILWGAYDITPQEPLGTYPTLEEAQQAAEAHHAQRKDPP